MSLRCCLVTLLVLLAGAAVAAAQNKHAVAVIIGNKNYANGVPEVTYAHRDAEAVKRFVIDVLGYRQGNIIDLRDATQAEMYSVFGNRDDFRGRAFGLVRPDKSDLLVYYSGHGVPGLRDHRGYLLPVNADPATAQINGYPIDLLYRNLAKVGARTVTVFIDACFSGDSAQGMLIRAASPVFVPASLAKATGITVLTAASGEEVASWDETARHGLFTEYLLRALYGAADGGDWGNGDGEVRLSEVAAYLNDEMRYQARRRFTREQVPTVQGAPGTVLARFEPGHPPVRARLDGDAGTQAAMVPPPKPQAPKPQPPKLVPVEAVYVALKNANVRAEPTVRSARVETLAAGTEIYVAGKTDNGAWLAVERDGRPLGYVYAPLLQRKAERVRPKPGETFKDCDECPEMVVVPAGSFMMGSPPSEAGRNDDEGPQHQVTISRSFAVARFEVTFAEWDACHAAGGCAQRPDDQGWGRDMRPVINVSWEDAKSYVAWLARRTGKSYRLLSEAEWEYVARAGTTTPFRTGTTISTAEANFNGNFVYEGGAKGIYRDRTTPVGSFAASAFSVHDFNGNVWEWVEDCWHCSYAEVPSDGSAWTAGSCRFREIRGGSWVNSPGHLRSAARVRYGIGHRDDNIGFRVARTLD